MEHDYLIYKHVLIRIVDDVRVA